MTNGADACAVLTLREFKRLFRQPSRLATAILTPLIFWVLAGAGLGRSFVMPGSAASQGEGLSVAYASYLLPGMATMVAMFASVMASISLIQDRQAGFLQSVLVSPAPRWAIVASKVIAGSLIATLQALLLIVGAVLFGLCPAGAFGVLGAGLVLALTSAAVIALGMTLAWRIGSISGFHGVMNLVLLPMWVLSGALFPASGASGWLAPAMWINPLHWSTLALGGALGVGEAPAPLAWLGGLGSLLFAGAACAGAWWVMERWARRIGAAGER
jgi:ABC-2 type transport system permease protein